MAATTAVDAAPAPQGPVDASGGGAAALLSAAAPAALAVAELPRRTAERGSTRSQAQRAAARRSQAAAPASRLVAASAPPAAGGGAVQLLPPPAGLQDFAVGASGGDALFGAPTAPPRPWPRAVLPALSGRQPFAAGFGLPQGEAFAPFQPRLARDPAAAPPAAGGDPDAGQAPADAGSGEPPIPDPAG
ncbi:MAG: hypothetical protein GX856_07830 [Gammaproteobacteria bacterium]|nr:hypothetical protein [Gammaproteobacteria bacterium]